MLHKMCVFLQSLLLSECSQKNQHDRSSHEGRDFRYLLSCCVGDTWVLLLLARNRMERWHIRTRAQLLKLLSLRTATLSTTIPTGVVCRHGVIFATLTCPTLTTPSVEGRPSKRSGINKFKYKLCSNQQVVTAGGELKFQGRSCRRRLEIGCGTKGSIKQKNRRKWKCSKWKPTTTHITLQTIGRFGVALTYMRLFVQHHI